MVSLVDTKEIQPTKQDIKVSTNLDFLELLLKDIDEKKEDDSKKDKTIKLEDILSEDKELKEFIKNEDLSLKIPISTKSEFKQETIKEIKNIITSKLKQENILLSKTEIKEFKKIDNIKELIKFADKKGLNIKDIKIEAEKIVEKLPLLKETKIDKSIKLTTKEILRPKHKQTIKLTPENTNQPIKINQTKQKVTLENILKTPLNNEIKKNIKNTDEKITKTTHQTLKTKNDVLNKIQNIKNEKIDVKENSVEISKNIKTETKTIVANTTQHTTKHHSINLDTLLNPKLEKIEAKLQKIEQKNENNINLNQTPINEIKAKSIQAKEVIKHFNNNLDDAIKNYKPPVSKVNIELNPKNLGKVEVTIIQRGNNIQVNMNTDQSNVALFQTHQAEFRQALSNIGFSNIDMSFSSNQDKERKQNQAKKSYKENEEQEISDIEIQANYRYA